MVMAVIVAFVAAAVLVALLCCGGALCWMGLHGPPEDNHQHCAACGYDLHGSTTTPDRCSECGASLLSWRAVAAAPRRIVLRPVWFGIALILGGSGPIAAAVSGL